MLGLTVRLATRNTLRRRTRTFLTAGMVVVGVALLLIALSWVRGSFGSILASVAGLGGHVRVVQPAFAEREELMPLYENLPDVHVLEQRLRGVPGVTGVEPCILTGVTVTVGEEIGDVFAAAQGASERYFRERMKLDEHLAEGRFFSGAADEVIIGAKVAAQAKVKIGDPVIMLGLTQDGSMSSIRATAVGISRLGGFLDQQVFLPLAQVQYLADISGGATELLVFTEDYETAPQLAEQLRALPELKPFTTQAWSEREPWSSLLRTVAGVQSIIVFIIVFLTALGIWNTMMMSVLERTHEVGVLRAMGLSRLGTVGLFVGEAMAIAFVGGVVGVALGLYPTWLLQKYGIRIGEKTAANLGAGFSEVVHAQLSLNSVLTAFGLGLVMALVGSFIPALRAASIQPVSAMRSGR